jgi:hypothetical protein
MSLAQGTIAAAKAVWDNNTKDLKAARKLGPRGASLVALLEERDELCKSCWAKVETTGAELEAAETLLRERLATLRQAHAAHELGSSDRKTALKLRDDHESCRQACMIAERERDAARSVANAPLQKILKLRSDPSRAAVARSVDKLFDAACAGDVSFTLESVLRRTPEVNEHAFWPLLEADALRRYAARGPAAGRHLSLEDFEKVFRARDAHFGRRAA